MVSRGLIGLARKQFTYQSKPLVDTSSYWKGCIKIAPSLLHYYCPMARDTRPMFGLSLGFLPMLTTTQAPWNFWHRSYHVWTNLDRCMDVAGLFKTLELNRPLSSNSFFFSAKTTFAFFSSPPFFLLALFFFLLSFSFLVWFAAYRAQKTCLLVLFHLNGCNFRLVRFQKIGSIHIHLHRANFKNVFRCALKLWNITYNTIKFTYRYIITIPRKNYRKKLRLHTVISKRWKTLKFSKPNSYKKSLVKK